MRKVRNNWFPKQWDKSRGSNRQFYRKKEGEYD